ncbi:hypothetical protein RvY_08456 [Ramazzottius varieornatus]|uniref:Uncharacterized protein n=1 Tax=Ramazzottius varieornatus TaxID=947166 RepID=A0A1D1VDZ1_RAMVA|nr:hypothetical protein RvY_08456 [Ramazzottius varieornatus]
MDLFYHFSPTILSRSYGKRISDEVTKMSWWYLKILVSCVWLALLRVDRCFVNGRQLCYNCSVEVNLWKEEPFHGTFPTDDIDCISDNRAALDRIAKRPNGYVPCQGDRQFCGAVFTEYQNVPYFRITRGCLDLRDDAYYTTKWEFGRVNYWHEDVRQRCSVLKHEFDVSELGNVHEKYGKFIACVCTDGDYCNHFTYDSMFYRYFHTDEESLTKDSQVDLSGWWAEEASDLESPVKDLDETTAVGYTGTTIPEFHWTTRWTRHWTKPTDATGLDVRSGQDSTLSDTSCPLIISFPWLFYFAIWRNF